jgi:class 3 adenylate cyclase/tetratricopeptide (TPR) repeat protein
MAVCASCGEENPDRARFCLACGTPLAAEAPAREERKVVTVLFADLVGFTGRAEKLDPEDVRATLSPYYNRLRWELERFGGTVEKFIGDAVMAVFGAPLAHEDDPERAVRAALAIREALAEDADLHVRIGITTGEALVTLGARPLEGEGMAAGDVVNTAARVQSAAPTDGVLVDETTYRATERAIVYREAEPVRAKGKEEPVAVWEALEARSRLGVDRPHGGGAPLVGRRQELDVLVDALARARSERAVQLVTLVGVPGIGKSRLVWELFQAVERDPQLIYWRQGRSLPYGEGITFWALGEMVKAHAGILETDAADTAAKKLRRVVEETLHDDGEASWVEGHLRTLVGLSSEVEARGDGRDESFAAWRRFFEGLAERSPLVLVFEDLHWADEGLLDFIDHLVDWATEVPLLAVCTARTELLVRRPGWGGGKPNATTLSLSPLSDEETARLLAELTERPVLPAETQAALLAHAGGNPLYAEEYARMLAERSDAGELALPETVQGIIAARLDGLAADEKELLQDAAVIGKVFWLGALATIGRRERWTVEEVLHGLERREFVRRERRSSVASETEYSFRHILVRDVAYEQIPRAARAEKHRRAAAWLESLAADRSEDRAEMLGHHYLAALEFARAAGQSTDDLAEPARVALREAGDRALALNAFETATRFYEAALALWPVDDADRGALLLEYGRALLDSRSEGEDVLRQASEALLVAGRPEAAAEAEVMIGELVWKHVGRDPADKHFERAEALVQGLERSPSKVYVLAQLARFQMLAGRVDEAIRLGREALGLAEMLGLAPLRVHLLTTIGAARVEAGDTDGVRDLERGIELGLSLNSPQAGRGYINLASMLFGLGDLAGCRRLHEEGMAWARRIGLGGHIRWLAAELVLDKFLNGEWDDAHTEAEAFIADAERSPHYMQSGCLLVRSAIRMARGDPEGALADSTALVEHSRRVKDPQNLHPGLGFHARSLVEAGRRAEAEVIAGELLELVGTPGGVGFAAWYIDLAFALAGLGRGRDLDGLLRGVREPSPWRDALAALADDDYVAAADHLGGMGLRPEEAYARLRAAERLIAEGRRAEGEVELSRARAFYREVGATRYLREADALLAATA